MGILYWKICFIKGGSKVERERERERGAGEGRNTGYPEQETGYPALEGMNRSCRITVEHEGEPSRLRAQEGGLLRGSRKKKWHR